MANKTTQSAQTKKTQNKALSGGVPAGWREACPPQNWRRVKLGDVAEINPLERLEKNSIAKKIPMEALEPFQRNISFFLEKEFKGGVKFRNGDTLVARITPSLENGKTAFVDVLNENEVGFGSTEFIVLRKKENITDEKFIYYLARSFDFRELAIKSMTGTSGRQRVQTNEVINYRFLLPPLPEQKAIAEALSSLDDKIDLLHRQNKTLEDMAQALFRKWFIDEADEGWESGKISDLVKILSGFAFKSKDFVECGKYRLITIKNVQDGYLDLSKASFLEKIPDRMPDYCLLNNGDILLSLTGNVGRCCLVTEKNLLLNQRVAKLQPQNKENWAFVYILFRQAVMRNLLEETAKGTAQANLSPVETANLPFKIPHQNILDKFSMVATPLIKKVLKNKSQIRTLENLRDTLLPKLMSGEVRVKDFTK